MQVEGALSRWSDTTQSGTISRADGGEEVPVHIRAFESAQRKPAVGLRVSFDLSHTWDGQPRARRVRVLRGTSSLPLGATSARLGWVLLAAFVALAVLAAQTWGVPRPVVLAYLVTSIVCATVVAGQNLGPRGWQEGLLIGLGLVGGWPGTVLAQQLSGHSAFRPSRHAVFVAVAIANIAGFLALAASA